MAPTSRELAASIADPGNPFGYHPCMYRGCDAEIARRASYCSFHRGWLEGYRTGCKNGRQHVLMAVKNHVEGALLSWLDEKFESAAE